MSSDRCTAADLAIAVYTRLAQTRAKLPNVQVIESLFENLFYASLHTEEGRPIVLHAVLIDPANPDPTPPERIVRDRWRHIRLAEPIALDPSSITKIAMATDPKSSSLAIYPDAENELWIWGLIDQQHRFHSYVTQETESGPERPGIVEVSVRGPGILVVSADYVQIAELRVDKLVGPQLNVFWEGAVHAKLRHGIDELLASVRAKIPADVYAARDHWEGSLTSNWISTLQRLVLRVRGFRHGGALLMTPDRSCEGLARTYPIHYERIRGALESLSVATILATDASDNIFEFMDEGKRRIPVDLYLDESVNNTETEDAKSELDGALWFTAVLSRVDGLVVLTPNLDILGFGAEITITEQPDKVWVASECDADENSIAPFNWERFGTRHRSMMRYCASQPASVGIVVSQDGAIRVMTMVDSRLVIWENPLLQAEHSGFMTGEP